MRILVAFALVALTLAGCIGEDEPTNQPEPVPVDTAADFPIPDAGALLAELESFVNAYGERAANLPAHVGARDYLAQQYADAGLEVWRQEFNDGIDQENIVGIKWGSVHPDQWVVVGGHYDMVTTDCIIGAVTSNVPGAPQCVTRPFSQGAYDDGGGTIMTVELARAYAQFNTTYTIAFVNFDGEERGLQGSGAFVREVMDDQASPYGNVTVRAMLNLDMYGLGWPSVDAPILFDENSPQLEAEVEALRTAMGMPDDAVEYHGITAGRSDYAHFMDRDVPTGFFISDFEEWQLPADLPYTVDPEVEGQVLGEYPFWHLQDTYETMELMAGSAEDLELSFQAAVELASGVLWRMAMDDTPLDLDA